MDSYFLYKISIKQTHLWHGHCCSPSLLVLGCSRNNPPPKKWGEKNLFLIIVNVWGHPKREGGGVLLFPPWGRYGCFFWNDQILHLTVHYIANIIILLIPFFTGLQILLNILQVIYWKTKVSLIHRWKPLSHLERHNYTQYVLQTLSNEGSCKNIV
jgi:hypothetical protein